MCAGGNIGWKRADSARPHRIHVFRKIAMIRPSRVLCSFFLEQPESEATLVLNQLPEVAPTPSDPRGNYRHTEGRNQGRQHVPRTPHS